MQAQIKIYHYGDCGPYDDFNPLKLTEDVNTAKLLYHIAKSSPYTLDVKALSHLIEEDENIVQLLTDQMVGLRMLKEDKETFSLNFTVILQEDLKAIDNYSKSLATELAQDIENEKHHFNDLVKQLLSYKTHDEKELLYHILGCHILDGLAIDSLSERGFFKTSKLQKDARDYLLFGFEDCAQVDAFSDHILCSCNRYTANGVSFISFGDAAGHRNDLYRFNRQVSSQLNRVEARQSTLNSYRVLLDGFHDTVGIKCSAIIQKIIEQGNHPVTLRAEELPYGDYLTSFHYLSNQDKQYQVSVPIFYPQDQEIIQSIHDDLMKIILPKLEVHFGSPSASLEITAIRHGVELKEILNEMWHQIFGNINEALVKSGVIKQPDYFEGEGRYLKAIYLE